jgi:hypothetical protein
MNLFGLSINFIAMAAALLVYCQAEACNEGRSSPELILIERYQDSIRLSKELNKGYAGVGNHLPLSATAKSEKEEVSPFTGLYVIHGKELRADSVLDCNIGKYSPKYAQLQKSGIFAKLSIKDIIRAKGKDVSWNDLRVFMDLGIKLPTPKSILDLKRNLEKDSIRIDAVFPTKEIFKQDPWFGVFYKETHMKGYIYGLQYKVDKDSLEYVFHEPYFAFKKTDFANNYMDNAGAVYILDTAAYSNENKLESYIDKKHE